MKSPGTRWLSYPASRLFTASLTFLPSTVLPASAAMTAFMTLPMSFALVAPVSATAPATAAASAIALNLQVRNCSISQYFFNADAFQLATFNGIPHLDHSERHDFQTYG